MFSHGDSPSEPRTMILEVLAAGQEFYGVG